MKNKLYVLLLISIISCQSPKESKESNTHFMYGHLAVELASSSKILKSQIREKLKNENFISEEPVKRYHNLSQNYLDYLDAIHSELTSKMLGEQSIDYNQEFMNVNYTNEYFFENGNYKQQATEFVSRMQTYREEILALIKDENLSLKVGRVFYTDSSMNFRREEVEVLHLLYQDKPIISVLTHIKYIEKSVLEFENEFIKNRICED